MSEKTRKLLVRVMAIVLAVLMAGGTAYTAIAYLLL